MTTSTPRIGNPSLLGRLARIERLKVTFAISLLVLIGAALLWFSLLPHQTHFQPDSASYVEQARSLLEGDGFQSRGFAIDEIAPWRTSHSLKRPDFLFPPGYPIAVAAGSALFQIRVDVAALWVTRIALFFLPLTIFLFLRPLAGFGGALCLAIVAGASPSVLDTGVMAASDIFSLTLSIISFGVVLTVLTNRDVSRPRAFVFIGGFLAGAAYLTRNANIALLLSLAASFLMAGVFLSRPMKRGLVRMAAICGAGTALAVFPPIVRNLIMFGSIQPYRMIPSTVGFVQNIHLYINAQITEILGSPRWGHLLGWSPIGLAAIAILVGVLVYLSIRVWPRLSQENRVVFVSSIIYASLGAAVAIVARTKYQWGEPISIRHAMPYTAFWLLPIAIILHRYVSNKKVLFLGLSALMLAWILLRVPAVYQVIPSPRDATIEKLIGSEKTRGTAPCPSRNDPLIISNYAFLYRIICDADALHLTGNSVADYEIPIRSPLQIVEYIRSNLRQIRPDVIALHPGRGISVTALPISSHDTKLLAARGWKIELNSPQALVLERFSKTAVP